MRRSFLFLLALLAASILSLTIALPRRLSAKQASELRTYSLSNGATIRLSVDWTARALNYVPPPAKLASSAPPMNFIDFWRSRTRPTIHSGNLTG